MIRKCKDIGMFVLDRGTCKHSTAFCRKNCYNKKMYKKYPKMKARDKKNEIFWKTCQVEDFKKILSRKKEDVKRFRFSTRGETFNNVNDIVKVFKIVEDNPKTLFWIPTRAWRKSSLKLIIEKTVKTLPNARVMASIDLSNSQEEINQLISDNWSTMFFGDNEKTENRFKCPKTWNKKKICNTCKNGCFSKKRVDIHLKKH